MAVGFDAIPFDVLVSDDARLPVPTPDADGFDYYEATVRLASRTAYDDLNDLLSGLDIIPAMAMRGGGLITLRWGAGRKVLTLPLRKGVEESRQAILVAIAPASDFLRDLVQVDVRFLTMESA